MSKKEFLVYAASFAALAVFVVLPFVLLETGCTIWLGAIVWIVSSAAATYAAAWLGEHYKI